MQYAIVLTVLATSAFGLHKAQEWNGLFATWNAIPNKGFDKMPRQLSEIGDFKLKDDACTGNKFYGKRYWLNDPALILLFDKNGYIAGIQTSVSKTQFTPSPGMLGFVDDGDYWTLTAYFVEPCSICKTGRTKEQFEKQGTGTGVWLQTGPNPAKDITNIPLNEPDVKKTLWGHGKCFPSMGNHYWYNVSSDMSCNNFYPSCLLYNGGKLNAFCLTINGNLPSPHYDFPHPTPDSVSKFMDPVPKCFFTDPSFKVLSTLHVYFHTEPRTTTTC